MFQTHRCLCYWLRLRRHRSKVTAVNAGGDAEVLHSQGSNVRWTLACVPVTSCMFEHSLRLEIREWPPARSAALLSACEKCLCNREGQSVPLWDWSRTFDGIWKILLELVPSREPLPTGSTGDRTDVAEYHRMAGYSAAHLKHACDHMDGPSFYVIHPHILLNVSSNVLLFNPIIKTKPQRLLVCCLRWQILNVCSCLLVWTSIQCSVIGRS